MDQEEFTELLNEDLSTEYQSIVQYNLHISTVTGPGVREHHRRADQASVPGAQPCPGPRQPGVFSGW